jgi:conjugal transfer pilus assembly protein TraW
MPKTIFSHFYTFKNIFLFDPTFFLLLILLAPLMLIYPSQVYAKDLGKIGTTYPIAENDLMILLKKHVEDLEKDGGLLKLQNEFEDDIRKSMDRPQPVGGISPTITPRDFLFDPTINITHDIKDSNNHILISQGTPENALDSNNNNFIPLIFYNADSKEQADWALKKDKELKGNDKLILVGGSVFGQMKVLGKSIYFDQGGMLTTHFGIAHVPTMVTQKGNYLLIQEVLPE